MTYRNVHNTYGTDPQEQSGSATGSYPVPDTEIPDIADVLDRVQQKIAPVWPLRDYVAVNPYLGFADQGLLKARNALRSISDMEMLMPVDYYREQFAAGLLSRADIDVAVDELVADEIEGAERIDVNQVLGLLARPAECSPTADSDFAREHNPDRSIYTLSETLDRHQSSHWSRLILEEIAKHCAAHYDQGQALWPSPWRNLPLYLAWRSVVQHDLSFEILGVQAFRDLVTELPLEPHLAILQLLKRFDVPKELWVDFLLTQSLMMPGWSAWVKYQSNEAEKTGEDSTDLAGLLAMRLCYEAAIAEQFNFHVDWVSVANRHYSCSENSSKSTDEELLRYALLKASENAFRQRLLDRLSPAAGKEPVECTAGSRLAQMVFCIDVRSERIRRHLEEVSDDVETFGFAGFFGLPIEFVELGETSGAAQVPALISPRFKVYEGIEDEDAEYAQSVARDRVKTGFLRKAWKEFQTSAASCFAFVETIGLFYAFRLLTRTIRPVKAGLSDYTAAGSSNSSRITPTLEGLNEQGICLTQQADMAESVLRGIGIVDNFARLIVFCGHGSQTENNPLQAGLDCGACGGHSGEPNAKFAAKLMNEPQIRAALADRGIRIPKETHFVAALHNTTTDEVQLFDSHLVPASHRDDLEQLQSAARSAAHRTRQERLSLLPGKGTDDLIRRSLDWSEVRPEWGLAGNGAFIAAPRWLTKASSLDGRSFLHSYDYRKDPEFTVLEQIMTAPMVVASWINMQYYASTVDPTHFGSGNKTVHNVVGQFGIFSGNGGDLMTGLPWQSVHDGQRYQHHALRLLAVIVAPLDAIETVIARHNSVADLVTNGWVQLVAVENGKFYRYTRTMTWNELTPTEEQRVSATVFQPTH